MKIKVKDNNTEIGGLLGALIAIPIICMVFSAIAVAFLTVVLILLSPLILLIYLLVR